MKKKILIVDDEKTLLDVLAEKFSSENFEVITAKNGQEGLDLAMKHHPDVILLDILMPVKDGMEMLCELRNDSWGKKARVVFLTNLSDKEKEMQSAHQGALDYLIKCNLSMDEIVKEVKQRLKVKIKKQQKS